MENAENQQQQPKQPKHDSGAADLEKVTDYAEEQEIAGGKLNEAFNAISSKHQKEANDKLEFERRLASVKISKSDVELIANEIEISKIKAERVLREQNGDPVAALRALLSS
jgi:NACalpha-BTF3-like transcription factor